MNSITIDGTTFRFYDHLYAVSRAGIVLRNLLPYEPRVRPDGYADVGRKRLLHRMVATCWCDRPEGAQHVHHKNHNKSDNRAANLEWVTPKQHNNDYHPGISRGHVMSELGKQKLRDLRKGSVTNEITKQKQREANLRAGIKPPPRPLGTKCSVEAIAKMRANSPNAAACEILGVTYPSFSAASRALGQKPHTLRKRCLSENFPDYKVRGE